MTENKKFPLPSTAQEDLEEALDIIDRRRGKN